LELLRGCAAIPLLDRSLRTNRRGDTSPGEFDRSLRTNRRGDTSSGEFSKAKRVLGGFLV